MHIARTTFPLFAICYKKSVLADKWPLSSRLVCPTKVNMGERIGYRHCNDTFVVVATKSMRPVQLLRGDSRQITLVTTSLDTHKRLQTQQTQDSDLDKGKTIRG